MHSLNPISKSYSIKIFYLTYQQGYWYGYDSSYDATTSNAFITAVLRVGHTLVNPELSRSSPNFGTQGTTLNLKTRLVKQKLTMIT